jgi:hypothetical protein
MAIRDYSGGCSDDRGAKFAHFSAHTEAFDLRARANTVKTANAPGNGIFSIPPKGPKNQNSKTTTQDAPRARCCKYYTIFIIVYAL